jgi:magnesium-transporting ATPase (P-type)
VNRGGGHRQSGVFNAILGLVQEGRAAGGTLTALKKRPAPTALVLRDGVWTRRAASGLVPGDTIRLSLGAMVPADARIRSGTVMVDQSMLTGESVPADVNLVRRLDGTGNLVRFDGGVSRCDQLRRFSSIRSSGRSWRCSRSSNAAVDLASTSRRGERNCTR